MPRDQDAQQYYIVADDPRHYVSGYDVVAQPIHQSTTFKSTSIHRVPRTRVKRVVAHEDRNPISYNQVNYIQETTSDVGIPHRTGYQEVRTQAQPKRRRLRYVPPQSTVKIFDEKIEYYAQPKIDTHNERGFDQIRNRRKPIIFNEPRSWFSSPRTDTYNDDYIRYKERERTLRYQQSYNYSQDQRTNTNGMYIANYDPVYDEYSRQYRPARLPQMGNRRTVRQRKHRQSTSVNRKNDRWHFIKPKTDSHNEHMLDYVQNQPRPRIINQLPRWRSAPKIDSFNDSYDSNYTHTKPVIFNKKPRWHARSKIDTGFATDFE
ncbi:hypothetical protein I4U23_030014 [Adineta vaga]|nr:hypothetical protein I4U23_030014 [Adineta vaga]